MSHASANAIPAKPAKLKSGEWGARVTGDAAARVQAGDLVEVTTKAGKSWIARAESVVYRSPGEDVALLTTERVERTDYAPRRAYAYGGSGSDYCGYPCPVSGRRCNATNGPCHDCQ